MRDSTKINKVIGLSDLGLKTLMKLLILKSCSNHLFSLVLLALGIESHRRRSKKPGRDLRGCSTGRKGVCQQ